MRQIGVTGLLLYALAMMACGDSNPSVNSQASTTGGGAPVATAASGLVVVLLHYDGGTLPVEVADTPQSRALGLGERDALAEDTGMLFDMGQVGTPGFWMRGMRFPLDFVWIDEQKRIIAVTRDVPMQPGAIGPELRMYRPPAPVRYVLEINAGAASRLGLDEGDEVQFELP
jgi:uncharacterized membrane protein (UPF0127 family)